MQTTLDKIVRHIHVSMFGVRRRGDQFVAECFLRRNVQVTSAYGDTTDAAIEALWAEIQRQFPDKQSFPLPPVF